MLKKAYWLLFAVFAALSGCLKPAEATYTQTCNYVTSTTYATASEVTYLQNYLSTRSIAATKDTSGIFYKIDSAGTGITTADVCSIVTINYVGNLLTTDNSNPQFAADNNASFQLGALIVGIQKGLPLIKGGGGITLYIPPSLAYGSTGGGTAIPANSYLKFSIQLTSVK